MKYPIMFTVVGLFLLSLIASSQQGGESDSVKARWDERYDRDMYIYEQRPCCLSEAEN